ncbi:MAGE-domain-containing protein [Rhizophagus clarus]|nr:MAGE-domain-containing protein [Rhizophagus clarus]
MSSRSSRRNRSTLIDDETEAGPSRPTRRTTLRNEGASNVHKRRRQDEEESEASSDEGSVDQYSIPTEKVAQKLTAEEIERKIKDVVRLALFSEFRKQPIKREDITKKVLYEHPRAYYEIVFNKAQERLEDIFGMKLAELPKKSFGTGGARKPVGNKDKTSKSYILKNVLPQEYRETDIINWGKNEQEGLLTVILSLIHVNGRVLSDDQLNHYFRRLYLVGNDKFDLEKLLSTFVKQGYLDRQKTSRTDQSQNSEKDPLEYRWGPRAKIEMSESNLIKFIRALFGHDVPPDFDKQIERSSGIELAS